MSHAALSSLLPQRRRLSRTTLGELVLGLLVGVAGGWVAGLVRVRRP